MQHEADEASERAPHVMDEAVGKFAVPTGDAAIAAVNVVQGED